MQLNGLRQWRVRFADTMDLDEFYQRFGWRLERHPETGAFGRWLNPLGRWDWWDLGGRFDGHIVGDSRSGAGRSIAQVSSGPSRGRSILANVENYLAEALGQQPIPSLDVPDRPEYRACGDTFGGRSRRPRKRLPRVARVAARGGRGRPALDRMSGRSLVLKQRSPGWACRRRRAGRPSSPQPTRGSRTTGRRALRIITSGARR